MSVYVLKNRFTMAEERAKAELERKAELEKNYNGLILSNKYYIPFEILLKVFLEIDKKSLLSCQLVCRNWLELIRGYSWREKAETILGERLPIDKPWKECLFVCDEQPFGRNLIRNHSGENNHAGNSNFEHWTVKDRGGTGWTIEKPPIGAPNLPDDPVFGGVNQCFVTSYAVCTKYQVINLVEEGFSKAVLDHLRPVIRVSEWFCSRHDCPASYSFEIRLLGESKRILRIYNFRKEMRDERTRNVWHKVTKYYKNYGPGLREIQFLHTGVDRRSWDGYYGAKMAGACVELLVPTDKDNDGASSSNNGQRSKSSVEPRKKESVDIWYPAIHNNMRPYVRNSRLRHSNLYGGRVMKTYSKFSRRSFPSGRRPFATNSRYRR